MTATQTATQTAELDTKIETRMLDKMTRPQSQDTVRFDASKHVKYDLGVMPTDDFRTLVRRRRSLMSVSCREEDGPEIETLYEKALDKWVLGFFGCRASDERPDRGIKIDGVILDYDVPFSFVRTLAKALPSEVSEVLLEGKPALRLWWD